MKNSFNCSVSSRIGYVLNKIKKKVKTFVLKVNKFTFQLLIINQLETNKINRHLNLKFNCMLLTITFLLTSCFSLKR